MAVVISSEENDYFSPSSLRRSHSQPQFLGKQPSFHTSASTSRMDEAYNQPVKVFSPDSDVSSPPSSPETVHAETSDLSFPSTPASNLSLDSDFEGRIHVQPVRRSEQIILPRYDDAGFYSQGEDLEPPPSPRTGDSYTVSPNDIETSTNTSRPESPDAVEHAEDDTAVRVQPSRHVDYLSHNWREEDIWESWKYIVSKRSEYSNSARLENASWRTWMKSKNNLKTVSPETLNWLKDCDVTWLYGPLQTGHGNIRSGQPEPKTRRLSGSGYGSKKPILKKRSMSEIMLQRSLSASSLVKQAAAAVQAQQKEGNGRGPRPILNRATTDYVTFPFSSRRISPKGTSGFASSTTSGVESPNNEKKHIHFNEQVEQCIAVEVKGDDDDEADLARYDAYNSDSDDGAVMMKKTVTKKKRPILKRARSSTGVPESKTIAMLPSTTLKYREDTPEPPETAMKHSTGYRSPLISPSSSQETLRPSKASGKLLFSNDDDDDDELGEEGEDPNSLLGWRPSKSSAGIIEDTLSERSSGLRRSTSSSSLTAEPAGMRRTESGMFMPYEEDDESGGPNEGIFGRVIDTVNTARDIAHVIWNVGWRK